MDDTSRRVRGKLALRILEKMIKVIIMRCVVYNKRNCIKHRKNYKRLHVFESTKSFFAKK